MPFPSPASVEMIITIERVCGLYTAFVEEGPFDADYEYHDSRDLTAWAAETSLDKCLDRIKERLKNEIK